MVLWAKWSSGLVVLPHSQLDQSNVERSRKWVRTGSKTQPKINPKHPLNQIVNLEFVFVFWTAFKMTILYERSPWIFNWNQLLKPGKRIIRRSYLCLLVSLIWIFPFSFFFCSIIEILPHGNGPRARNHHRPSSLQIVGITRSRPVQQRAQHPNDISKFASPLSLVFLFSCPSFPVFPSLSKQIKIS